MNDGNRWFECDLPRSQFPFYAKTKDRTQAVILTQAVSKIEMRAARRLVKLANQSPNPYFAGIATVWPSRPSWTTWPTNRTANGVGRSNFKIGPTIALNPRPNPKANFEIGTPDPNSKPSPPKERQHKNQATAPHPNHTTTRRQY